MKKRSFVILLSFVIAMIPPVSAQETFEQLFAKGNAAFNQSDFTSASYYFNRMREHEYWDAFPGKIDTLTNLAFIEESQSRFANAADLYRLALETLSSSASENQPALLNYYKRQYAEALERAGYYKPAEKIYWELYDVSGEPERQMLLFQIIQNYTFQNVTTQQLERLQAEVKKSSLNELGWKLADLFRIQGNYKGSVALFDELWKSSISEARSNLSSMIEAYSAIGKLDEFKAEVDRLSAQEPIFHSLAVDILIHTNRDEEALQQQEAYLKTVLRVDEITNAGNLIGIVPNEMLFQWLDLLQRLNRQDDAIEYCRQILLFYPGDLGWRERLSRYLDSAGRRDEAASLWETWAEENKDNPIVLLNAAERLGKLGGKEKAKDLLQKYAEDIPPVLKLLEGNTALQLGLFEQAVAAYSVSAVSGNIQPGTIVTSILNFASAAPSVKPLVSELIGQASGLEFGAVPLWLRQSLLELGAKYRLEEDMDGLIESSPTDVWNIQVSQTAMKYGNTAWAKRLLHTVSEESVLRQTAEESIASLVGDGKTIPNQRQAADLLSPSVRTIVESASGVEIHPPQLAQMFQYIEYRLGGFQPGEALDAIRAVESSSNHANLSPNDSTRLRLARATAMAQLASFKPALELLDGIQLQPYSTEAFYLKAQIHLAEKQFEEANAVLTEIVENQEYWQKMNDALALMVAMEPLVGEPLELFCRAQTYLLQGRYENAYPVLNELAVKMYGEDTEEWARYTIGRLRLESGDRGGAVEEWERLLLDVDHPVYHGLVRYQLLHQHEPSSSSIVSSSDYIELLTRFPNTLFADLARLETQEQPDGVTP